MSQKISHEERLNILNQYLKFIEHGNFDEAKRIIQQLPLAPELADIFKRTLGTEYLKNSGFDLSLAEESYGKEWLTR